MPDHLAISVYLDANVLFSASYATNSPFLKFWRLKGVTPLTSAYALDEVQRNIKLHSHLPRFEALRAQTSLMSDANPAFVPKHIVLAEKDRPILAAAIAASLDYLVTGDKHHFAHLYDMRIEYVTILRPLDFLKLHEDRLIP